ncbi:Hydroperoxy fatty acid reductase gpx1 [Gemmata obscuriglobus]|uniref:Glutathione peroxidase n=1 Tax=Gemmata obscuriglobus TaxID=114 RepID=A0A2Z3H1G5_9BACT|nr:glutathione peroxidase [Gemmata obscuriglobus]AWM40609.1 glutathione peroxidase [Gemmata obscuriglobus]QEG26129.1 Hydroperoxy fatty acid reductase gpx1 [Gemmata obscuriglobus]VTS00670.1 glutathione peroxidase : Glutathione peroxidase OS=Sulfurospirillum deleyianum (strain ATCC 51133 / DSM 6946 / 5175) GN=Sdel_1334 PE=3 SV=1: GSHPx [Gemmata obscuriglobus UQM 2246]
MSTTAASVYDISVKAIDGQQTTLEQYRGKVLLVVNVASKCGFTGQYKGLEELQRKYKDRGLVVLGFPCNQFMGQEPGNEEEIKSFCSLKYDVTFPMFAKVDVNGGAAHPLYQHLKDAARGTLGTRGIKWNFTKFLVDRNGNVVSRRGPTTTPQQLEAEIEKLLG